MENLQRLRVLQAVAHHGSFTAAGGALNMSQPAVSQQVSALEKEMGARLVERTTLGARLTPEGEVVLRHAQKMLASFTDARRELDRLRSGDLTPVRVAAFPTACAHLLPQAAALWRRRFPALPFELIECDSDVAVELARHGKADVALASDYAAYPIDLDHLTVQALSDDPLLLALPASHPLASTPAVDIHSLETQAWIIGSSFACAESLRAICGVAGFTPLVALESIRFPTMLGLVAAGHGAALVPASALTNPPAGVAIRPLRPMPPPRRRWAVAQSKTAEPVAHLFDCLLATASKRSGHNT